MIEALRHDSFEMPPDEKLDDKTIAGMVKWIAAGAPWPKGRGADAGSKESVTRIDNGGVTNRLLIRSHRACQALSGVAGELDQFILAKFERERPESRSRSRSSYLGSPRSLCGSPGCRQMRLRSKRRSCRRFDYEQFVDELLQSPAYGENQARYWLDLVRYADTDGLSRRSRPPRSLSLPATM